MESLPVVILHPELEKSNIEQDMKLLIQQRLVESFNALDVWKAKSKQMVVTDASQVDMMKECREARLVLKKTRVSADKVSKELTSSAKELIKVVGVIQKSFTSDISELEEHFLEQEEFVEREAQRKAEQANKLLNERMQELGDLVAFIPQEVLGDIGTISDSSFEMIKEVAQMRQLKSTSFINMVVDGESSIHVPETVDESIPELPLDKEEPIKDEQEPEWMNLPASDESEESLLPDGLTTEGGVEAFEAEAVVKNDDDKELVDYKYLVGLRKDIDNLISNHQKRADLRLPMIAEVKIFNSTMELLVKTSSFLDGKISNLDLPM